MSNRSKGFSLVAGKRANRSPFWSVSGSVGGRQLRRQFSVRADALAFIEQKNSELLGHDADQAQVMTRLKPDEVRDAETATAQLAREFPGKTLLDVTDYHRQLAPVMTAADAARFGDAFGALKRKYPDANLAEVCAWFTQHFRPAKSAVTLKIALEHYLADVLRRKGTGSLSEWQLNSIGFAMAQLERFFGPDESLADLTTYRLKEYLRGSTKARDGSEQYSNKTWSNKRGYLTTFFSYCQEEGWLDQNPAKGLKKYKRKDFNRPSPCVLSTKGAKALMTYVETHAGGRLVPFFVLTLFCGIRPTWKSGEISRIKPGQLNLAGAELSLQAVDTKTKKPRTVRLEPNVVKWLTVYPLAENPIIARNFKKLYFKLRKDFSLGYDVLRHTYCSMLVGKFRSVGDAALQAGNSEDVMWGNYLNLVTAKEAKAFWRIIPNRRSQ